MPEEESVERTSLFRSGNPAGEETACMEEVPGRPAMVGIEA